MRLEQLIYLVEIADYNSMYIASENLYVSRQNISKAIKQLEQELGTVLFIRSNQGVFLTVEGQYVYGMAKAILKNMSQIIERYRPLQLPSKQTFDGPLTILANMTFRGQLAKCLNLLFRRYPNLKTSVNFQITCLSDLELAKPSAHIYLIYFFEDEEAHLQKYRHLFDRYFLKKELLKVYMNCTSPYASQKNISLKTLSALPMIDLSGTLEIPSFTSRVFAKYGYKSNIVLSCNSSELVFEYLANHDVYCFGTNDVMSVDNVNSCHDIRITSLKEKLDLNFLLLIPKAYKNLPQVQAFIAGFSEIVHFKKSD